MYALIINESIVNTRSKGDSVLKISKLKKINNVTINGNKEDMTLNLFICKYLRVKAMFLSKAKILQ